MKLSILERIQLLGVLPAEGDFSTLKIIRGLQEDLSFSEGEIKKTELKLQDNRYTWKADVKLDKDVQIGEKGTDIIVDALKKLDGQKKLPMQMFDLYEKFIKDKAD